MVHSLLLTYNVPAQFISVRALQIRVKGIRTTTDNLWLYGAGVEASLFSRLILLRLFP